MRYQVLVAPMVQLGSYPHRLHLPCYAALRVEAGANMRCSAYRMVLITAEDVDGKALRQRSDEAMVEVLTAARQAMPAEGGGRPSTRVTTGGRWEKVIPGMQQLPRSGWVHRLRARVLLVLRAPPLRSRLR